MRESREVRKLSNRFMCHTEGVPFPLPSKMPFRLHNIKNTNKFSEVTSCLKFQLSHATFQAFRRDKMQFETQL